MLEAALEQTSKFRCCKCAKCYSLCHFFAAQLTAVSKFPESEGLPFWIGQVLGNRFNQSTQLPRRLCGQNENLFVTWVLLTPDFVAVFLNDHVCIGATRAEGADSRAPRIGSLLAIKIKDRLLPGAERGLHTERRRGEIDLGIELCEIRTGNELLVPELEQHLGQSRNSGRAFQMSDIGLDRSDGTVGLRLGL